MWLWLEQRWTRFTHSRRLAAKTRNESGQFLLFLSLSNRFVSIRFAVEERKMNLRYLRSGLPVDVVVGDGKAFGTWKIGKKMEYARVQRSHPCKGTHRWLRRGNEYRYRHMWSGSAPVAIDSSFSYFPLLRSPSLSQCVHEDDVADCASASSLNFIRSFGMLSQMERVKRARRDGRERKIDKFFSAHSNFTPETDTQL